MRGTDRPAGILMLMLIACPVSGASAADQSPLALPDVSVTAPPITPPWKKFSPISATRASKRINGRT